MLNTSSLVHLAHHYGTTDLEAGINFASKELDAVLDETREYPPFIWYLMLDHLDGKKRLRTMSREEKTEVFWEVINELKRIYNNE